MCLAYFSAYNELRYLFAQVFSRANKQQYRREISSIYFNFALIFPLFKELVILKGERISLEAKRRCILVASYLLVDDILLDEVAELPNNPFAKLSILLRQKLVILVSPKILEKIDFLKKKQKKVKKTGNYLIREDWFSSIILTLCDNWNEQELSAFANIGAYLKFADDFADRVKDAQEMIVTPFTECREDREAQNIFAKQEKLTEESLISLPYDARKIRQFWYHLTWQVAAFLAYEEAKNGLDKASRESLNKSFWKQMSLLIRATSRISKQ